MVVYQGTESLKDLSTVKYVSKACNIFLYVENSINPTLPNIWEFWPIFKQTQNLLSKCLIFEGFLKKVKLLIVFVESTLSFYPPMSCPLNVNANCTIWFFYQLL